MCWICFRLSINKLPDTPEEKHRSLAKLMTYIIQHSSSVQSLSCVRLFVTPSSAESECVPAHLGLRICEIKTESRVK